MKGEIFQQSGRFNVSEQLSVALNVDLIVTLISAEILTGNPLFCVTGYVTGCPLLCELDFQFIATIIGARYLQSSRGRP